MFNYFIYFIQNRLDYQIYSLRIFYQFAIGRESQLESRYPSPFVIVVNLKWEIRNPKSEIRNMF